MRLNNLLATWRFFDFLGIVLAGGGLLLAWQHPLNGLVVSLLYLLFFTIGLIKTHYWLLIVPAALPVIDLAPWSGWIIFEEFDLLVLAMVAGGYFRLSKRSQQTNIVLASGDHFSFVDYLIIISLAISTLMSVARGFADAGGFSFGFYQGYYEPLNSLRLGKSFFLALCLWPLWQQSCRENPTHARTLLCAGIVVGLALATLGAIWERAAFPGLLNFSADYRTTSLFWEMHVGGAALDGFLALAMPFAVWGFTQIRNTAYIPLYSVLIGLSAYACLTTFSRGVYAAVPLGIALFAILALRNTSSERTAVYSGKRETLQAALKVVLFGAAAFWVFPTSGYRGMLSLYIAFALFHPVSLVLGKLVTERWLTVLVFGVLTIGLSVVVGFTLPKGAYLVFALGCATTLAALWLARNVSQFPLRLIVLAGYQLTLTGTSLIALHWGGELAFESMSFICLALFMALIVSASLSVPLQSIRWHAGLLGVLLIVGFGVATFSGGQYMSERFSSSERDMTYRLTHWKNALEQLKGSDWILGKGSGRYPAHYFFGSPDGEHPGEYRYAEEDGNGYLRLSGGKYAKGWGELFRLTQRIKPGFAPYTLQFEARADKDTQLYFEICEKHLLYRTGCVEKKVLVKGRTGKWQTIETKLTGAQPSRGLWYAPKLVSFSVAMESFDQVVHLDNIVLHDTFGENLLVNGDFTSKMAHWFFSSDHHHMPWHMKSLFFHILFEQGLFGLTSISLIIAIGGWRLIVGSARQHPLAPVLAGSLLGFMMVGLFDSLLDVPRLATLFYFLLLIAFSVREKVGLKNKNRKYYSKFNCKQSSAKIGIRR